jgi:hypothetical protein
VQRLQIQLLVGFGWNKASCRPLHGLSYRMGVSEIILVPLPKRAPAETALHTWPGTCFTS